MSKVRKKKSSIKKQKTRGRSFNKNRKLIGKSRYNHHRKYQQKGGNIFKDLYDVLFR